MLPDFDGHVLPPFPLDDNTLDLIWTAIHPNELNPDAERRCSAYALDRHLAAAELRGRQQGRAEMVEALRDEGAQLFMLAHQRNGIKGCSCGWADLGKSFVRHVLDRLVAYLDSLNTVTEEGGNGD